MFFLELFLLLFVFHSQKSVNAFQCPNGTFQMPNENSCFFLVYEKLTYPQVADKCKSLGSFPTMLKNAFESSYTFVLAQNLTDSPYIGVEKHGNIWTYADGSPLQYTNWAQEEPRSTSGYDCAVMDHFTGKWVSSLCTEKYQSICTAGVQDQPGCPSGWKYFDKNQQCYYLKNVTYFDGAYIELYDYYSSEAICQSMGAHLVSIHSKDEDDFVANLITSNFQNIATPKNNSCTLPLSWIGLYLDYSLTGSWTDNSPYDYFNAGSKRAAPSYWTMANDQSCNQTGWIYTSSFHSQFPRFICKMSSKSQLVLSKMEN